MLEGKKERGEDRKRIDIQTAPSKDNFNIEIGKIETVIVFTLAAILVHLDD